APSGRRENGASSGVGVPGGEEPRRGETVEADFENRSQLRPGSIARDALLTTDSKSAVVGQFDRVAGLPLQSLRLGSVPRECLPDLIGARDGVRRADFDDECGCSLPEEEKAARAPPSRAPHAAEQANSPPTARPVERGRKAAGGFALGRVPAGGASGGPAAGEESVD